MGSKPVMMPPTPRTVSPTAGCPTAATFWICWIVSVSGNNAFGHCVADATAAVHSSAATARKRVSILRIGIPLGAGGRNEYEARSGGVRCLLAVASWRGAAGLAETANCDLTWGG